MIKIAALNEEEAEDSDSEVEVTPEALEQIALKQYAKALELQRKGNLPDATQLLKDLLNTELLYEIKKPAPDEKVTGPLLNLKYLCYKNLATMLNAAGKVNEAIDAYTAASELDDTDVTLWHRMGKLCMTAKQYELALHAFQRGTDCNPRHWPCLDKIVTLLLGLDYKEACIATIYDALQLDPGYLRGLVYRRHIFKVYKYLRKFMEYLNPIYKWNEDDDEPIDEIEAEKLLHEAKEIFDTFVEQQKAEHFMGKLPDLKLKKPITELTWSSVGDSLVHMHHYMSEQAFSHACYLELIFEKGKLEEPMEICEEVKKPESNENKPEDSNIESDKTPENGSETEVNEASDKEKAATDTEKVESDLDTAAPEAIIDAPMEPKTQKKPQVRRRGSDLSFLQQWNWCNKRRSGRKKPVNRQDRLDDSIYDTLRRMVPTCLIPEVIEKKDQPERETSPDINNLDKLFEEKTETDKKEENRYFGTENEQNDVQDFLNKYAAKKHDIISMLENYLDILSSKWRDLFPESLSKIYVEAKKCYQSHVDIPQCTDDDYDNLLHFVKTNLLAEELIVNEKLNRTGETCTHDLDIIESIGLILSMKPHIFVNNILEFMLRYHWVKLHTNMLNKSDELAIDSLYQLSYEFEDMGEHHDHYSLNIVNFKFKPVINEQEVIAYIKFLERNSKLSTVMDLYERGNYEEVLSIILDSFEQCKDMAKNQEEEMTLDFSVQLSLLLDTYWALKKVDDCFKWSLICLNEALKHYFRYTSGTREYDKWTRAIVKILSSMEHILTLEGLVCLDYVSERELSQCLENLIRIIGHQVETNSSEMPFDTVAPWIIMHYILQREEDLGRSRVDADQDKTAGEDVPNPLMVLFLAHEQLGNRGWCCKSDGKLLFFILDSVVPRIRSPILAKALEQVGQHMEQVVYCLFGHPARKNKIKYLADHNVNTYTLDWKRAQQLYEIFRPPTLPALEGKISGISADTEQLFRSILDLLPPEYEPQKYLPEIEKYIKGTEDKLPSAPQLLPFKMRDIYFLLGDYYFKKEEGKSAIKYNMLDVIINNDRLESWAQISLAKAVNLERILNSCKNLNNEREYLNPAKSVIRCFKRSLELDPSHCNMWIEYGMFVYTVHSFCSRLLKQASESLSMEDFASLEQHKEDMLDTTQKCFITVMEDHNNSVDTDKTNEDSWLHFYMLGKVAEKRNKPPSVYLDFYMKGVKSLQETNATYPLKINYSSPTHLCNEVLELHYRMHASILKYIEQHENKPIPCTVGKVFENCIEEWKNGPFAKKCKKDGVTESETDLKTAEPVHAANILKRSISDAGEENNQEAKKLKLESAAAKVRRSASYDTERIKEVATITSTKTIEPATVVEEEQLVQDKKQEIDNIDLEQKTQINSTEQSTPKPMETSDTLNNEPQTVTAQPTTTQIASQQPVSQNTVDKQPASEPEKKVESSSSTSSSSSSDSSSSDSSSGSTSDSSRDSGTSNKTSNEPKNLTDEEIMKIVYSCLDSLEDCASRFPPHYKAIYRLAHYNFYYKKGKDIERCRDLMLSNFTTRSGQKLGGLFSERKTTNFFNNIWKIPTTEVDRAGGFAFHMSRSVLLTMEILKEIDDHKTLLDLSLHLQRIPDPDKKYLRDSDREDLAQQAFSLCVQSLKGQLLKFSQQADLKSNEVERKALKSLMLDIYRAYQRVQKQPNSKQFTNLLIEAFKLVTTVPITENMNLVDLSMKFCQSYIQTLKQQATQASLEKSQNAMKKQTAKTDKPSVSVVNESLKPAATSNTQQKPVESKSTTPTSSSLPTLPKMSTTEMAAAFQNYLPMLNDPVLSQQAAAALSLSYLSNISALAGYSSLQNKLQSSIQSTLQNSFQAEFYRQFLGQSFSGFGNLAAPPPKKKRAPKISRQPAVNPSQSQSAYAKPTKSYSASSLPSVSKATSSSLTSMQPSKSFSGSIPSASKSSVLTGIQKPASASLAPSMGTVLASLPASMTASLSSFGGSSVPHSRPSSHTSLPTHMSTSVNAPSHKKAMSQQQVSPSKTLQEKLAERQKNVPGTSKQEINASISRLPSSLTITKSAVPKPQVVQTKKPEVKKSLFTKEVRPKPITTDEIIILDDD